MGKFRAAGREKVQDSKFRVQSWGTGGLRQAVVDKIAGVGMVVAGERRAKTIFGRRGNTALPGVVGGRCGMA
jgi:hypothetical protein